MVSSAGVAVKSRKSTYRYVAFTNEERPVRGTIAATTEAAAAQLLVEKGYRLVSIELAPSKLSLEQLLPSFFGIKPREVIVFSRQLATLLESGVSLLPALELLHDQMAAGKGFKRVIGSIIDDLRIGKAFSEAIGRHPDVFNQIYSRTIGVGERTGKLESTLRQLAEFMEKQSAFAKKLTRALTYPSIVLGIAVVVSFVLITVVLPPLTNMFENMRVSLPITTKILIALGHFATAYKLHLLVALASSAVLAVWYVKQPKGQQQLDRLRLTAPLIGPLVHMGELGRITRTTAILLDAGVPLQEIMEMLPQTSTNSVVRESLRKIHQGLLLGEGLSRPMSKDRLFPPLMVQMITVAEESNTLGYALGVLAYLYESSTEERVNAVLGMVAPVTTILIALVTAFISLSVVMPIYQLSGSFR